MNGSIDAVFGMVPFRGDFSGNQDKHDQIAAKAEGPRVKLPRIGDRYHQILGASVGRLSQHHPPHDRAVHTVATGATLSILCMYASEREYRKLAHSRASLWDVAEVIHWNSGYMRNYRYITCQNSCGSALCNLGQRHQYDRLPLTYDFWIRVNRQIRQPTRRGMGVITQYVPNPSTHPSCQHLLSPSATPTGVSPVVSISCYLI